MTPKKPEWFEMTEEVTPASGLRKVNKTLPIGAFLVAGAVLFGGSIFAQDQSADSNIASSSVAETAPVTSNTVSTPPQATSLQVPTIAPVAGVSYSDDDDDHRGGRGRENEDEDEEGDDD